MGVDFTDSLNGSDVLRCEAEQLQLRLTEVTTARIDIFLADDGERDYERLEKLDEELELLEAAINWRLHRANQIEQEAQHQTNRFAADPTFGLF